MKEIDNIQKYKIYVDAIKVTGTTDNFDFFYNDGSTHRFPKYDFYLPVFLKRTYEIHEYVDIKKDDKIEKIVRQEINPYFIEFGFFDSIKRNKTNYGGELSVAMINFIKIRRPDVANLSTNDLRNWFDEIGINEFPWNEGTSKETTIDDIDGINFNSGNIISKGKFFGLDINK